MSKKKNNEVVFSFSSDDAMPKHFFDKKGEFVGSKNTKGDGFIRIKLERGGHGGKVVTAVYGFDEKADLDELCREFKKKAGSGGSVKDGRIEIQGDKVELLLKMLTDKEYKIKVIGK